MSTHLCHMLPSTHVCNLTHDKHRLFLLWKDTHLLYMSTFTEDLTEKLTSASKRLKHETYLLIACKNIHKVMEYENQ